MRKLRCQMRLYPIVRLDLCKGNLTHWKIQCKLPPKTKAILPPCAKIILPP